MSAGAAARIALALVCSSAPGTPWAADVSPFASAAATRELADPERRIWAESVEFDRALRRSGQLAGDRELDAYLQQLCESLYPEFAGVVKVRAVRDPALNAFALPNGSLYLHVGLIGRVENEAQLATVLAHEAAHFVHRHGLRQHITVKDTSAFALGATMLGGNIGALLGNLAALSSIYGYSRDLEREADSQGFERLMKAGYSVSEGTRVFEILEAESKLLEIKEPFMFSSHPKLHERIESFRELAAKQGALNGRVDAERFLAVTRPARLAWLEAELARGRHKSVIYHLAREGAETRYATHASYYLGEAYRLRAEKDDEALAEAAYRRALDAAPDYAPTYRALGVLYLKRGDKQAAAPLLRDYLARSPAAADAAYVRQYLEDIDRTAPENGS